MSVCFLYQLQEFLMFLIIIQVVDQFILPYIQPSFFLNLLENIIDTFP